MRTILAFTFLSSSLTGFSQETLTLERALYFSQSGIHTDGFPHARFSEDWGIRYGSGNDLWVLSTNTSFLAGYDPSGQSWGIGNILASGKIGIGTTTPSEKLTISGTGTTGAEIVTDGTASSRSVLSFIRGSGFWNIGMNMDAGNTDNFHFRYNGSSYPFTIQAATGNVGIGTPDPNEKLTVNGTIYGKEVKVDLNVPAPDYVFKKDYDLASLEEVKAYIEQHGHLPEVPSAKEMEENGINIGEMNMTLLKKMEELTLYVIQLKQENEEIKKRFEMNQHRKMVHRVSRQ